MNTKQLIQKLDQTSSLSNKIKNKKAVIGVIGMGYVGRSLAELTTAKGFKTIGFEILQERADAINNQGNKLLSATTDMSVLKDCDVVLICVQTPVDENKLPDLRFVESATGETAKYLRKGQLVIVESSIATGTTRNVVLPILEKTGLKVDQDYFLGYSPERVDPGNKKFNLDDIPKVVSGIDKNSLQTTTLFYEQIMKQVVPVSTMETGEMVKIFENTFRLINISLVNQVKAYAETWGIDMHEVVNAASTKPFGFLAHYPSPGAGGHCIPVDPFYMYDDAKKRGVDLRMIQEAGKINDEQPQRVVDRALTIMKQTNGNGMNIKHPVSINTNGEQSMQLVGQKGGVSSKTTGKVLIIGLAYKPDIDDMRESPSMSIWKALEEAGCEVGYHDPYIKTIRGKDVLSEELTVDTIKKYDMIVIATNHSNIDYEKLASYGTPILDTRNIYSNGSRKPHIYRI